MNPLALEWVEKAEGDLATATRELRARIRPNYDSACFHAQQMVEKYLKALLQEYKSDIPRTHNLVELLSLCLEFDRGLVLLEPDLKGLDGYAVRIRYPGQSASKADASAALKIARAVRGAIWSHFGFEKYN